MRLKEALIVAIHRQEVRIAVLLTIAVAAVRLRHEAAIPAEAVVHAHPIAVVAVAVPVHPVVAVAVVE